jgi:Mannosyl-glycoprotein endo-beta-N-acetylglucosaminidase
MFAKKIYISLVLLLFFSLFVTNLVHAEAYTVVTPTPPPTITAPNSNPLNSSAPTITPTLAPVTPSPTPTQAPPTATPTPELPAPPTPTVTEETTPTITPTPTKTAEELEQERKAQEERENEAEKKRIRALASRYDLTSGEPTAAAIEVWLIRCNSPILNEAPPGATIGQVFTEMGRKYGVNPAYAVAFFIKESSCGTLGDNLASRNFGNIRLTPGHTTLDGVWRAYPTWTDGMEDWFKLIREVYLNNGLNTLDEVVSVYAPSFENDSELYMLQTLNRVDGIMWESQWLKDTDQAARERLYEAFSAFLIENKAIFRKFVLDYIDLNR